MMDDYAYNERVAICVESGMSYAEAKRVADAELPKPESEAVMRLKALRASQAERKLKNESKRYGD
jgi:hypothetical protein